MVIVEAGPSLEMNGSEYPPNSLGHFMLLQLQQTLKENGVVLGNVIETKKGPREVVTGLLAATNEVVLRPMGANTEEETADALLLARSAQPSEETTFMLNFKGTMQDVENGIVPEQKIL